MKQLQKSDLKEGEIYVSNPSYSNSKCNNRCYAGK